MKISGSLFVVGFDEDLRVCLDVELVRCVVLATGFEAGFWTVFLDTEEVLGAEELARLLELEDRTARPSIVVFPITPLTFLVLSLILNYSI